ncbi:MAG: 3D domain-containing protein [Nitrospirae bacterium]|nr:3D domain-containing protein [Nitrospirota bacterium]
MSKRSRCLTVFSVALLSATLVAVIYHNRIITELKQRNTILSNKVNEMEETFLSNREKDQFEITAYDPSRKSCGKWAKYNLTKSGTTPQRYRTVAVDPSVIPLGSLVYIESVGWAIAEDTGNLVKGKTIDVFFDSYMEAKQFGRQKLTVYYNRNT